METRELITPEMLWTVILNAYKDSINEISSLAKVSDTYDINNLTEIERRMRIASLSETKNYELLVNKINDIQFGSNNIIDARSVIEFLNYMKNKYPEAILLPYKKLYNILDKYDLECAPIRFYDKIIPSKNIEEMMSVNITEDEYSRFLINMVTHLVNITIISDMECDEVTRTFSKIPFRFNGRSIKDVLKLNDNIPDELINHVSIKFNSSIYKNEWFIIAQSEDIKSSL